MLWFPRVFCSCYLFVDSSKQQDKNWKVIHREGPRKSRKMRTDILHTDRLLLQTINRWERRIPNPSDTTLRTTLVKRGDREGVSIGEVDRGGRQGGRGSTHDEA